MRTNTEADMKDARGYSPIHHALVEGDLRKVTEALKETTERGGLTMSGATLEEFADGRGKLLLLKRAQELIQGRSL